MNSPNWEFATMFLGVIPIVVFGGGFWPTMVAVIVGSALGAATVGLLSTWGPRFGVPRPVVDTLPQLGDLSFIVGFVVAAGVYFALAGKSAAQAAAAAPAA